ncbi:MAG: tetratricopeptide repeat protein [Proteobacteria bacterium]|nr:tetratricopeptide repeat protein [Pseudomonadota bacterium]
MYDDKRGLAFTASSQAAVDAFDDSIDEFLASGRDAAELLKRVSEADPDMIMGQVLRGYFNLLPSHAHLVPLSREALAKAQSLAAGATPRERMHVEALAAWCEGDIRRMNAIWDSILIDHPHDILALRIAHTMHFFLGDLAQMRDSMARVMPRWDESVPGYGYVLGCRAFSLEENNDLARAEPMGKRAVEINENDIWAGHCVAHVLEAQGRRQDGIDWIDGHEAAWQKRGIFARHMWWHRALHYLELERFDDVLAAYDREFWPEPFADNIDICNASGTLMRLDMLGIDVGDRWESVADVCAAKGDTRLRPFNDVHYMMALTKAGRHDAAQALLQTMRAFADEHTDGTVTLAAIYRNAGIPVAEAIMAYGAKDDARVIDIMMQARYGMLQLGGSWAQRDVWDQMLIHAAIRDERHDLARVLTAERTDMAPTSAPSWAMYGEALEKCGATAKAQTARARASALRSPRR